jgi:hypothetical protein
VLSLLYAWAPRRSRFSAQHRFVSVVLLTACAALIVQEGWNNLQSLGLALCWVVIGLAGLRSARTSESPATKTAGAQSSAL